jgi:hypothetical protein
MHMYVCMRGKCILNIQKRGRGGQWGWGKFERKNLTRRCVWMALKRAWDCWALGKGWESAIGIRRIWCIWIWRSTKWHDFNTLARIDVLFLPLHHKRSSDLWALRKVPKPPFLFWKRGGTFRHRYALFCHSLIQIWTCQKETGCLQRYYQEFGSIYTYQSDPIRKK